MGNGLLEQPAVMQPWLTPKDAAKLLKVNVARIYYEAKKSPKKGGPPTRYIGRQIRFPPIEFEKWALAQTTRKTKEKK